MTTLREAAQQALEALEAAEFHAKRRTPDASIEVAVQPAITALRTALAEQPAGPDAEPVAWRWLYRGSPDSEKCFPMPGPDADVIAKAGASEFPRTVQYLYTTPQPANQPLTDEEIYECERIAAIRHHRHKNSIRGQQITDMTDRDPIWDALKEHSKAKFDVDRARFMAQAVERDDGGWTKHTEYHWSRTVGGKRLDYWPSRKKWQYEGNTRSGDVMAFIRRKI